MQANLSQQRIESLQNRQEMQQGAEVQQKTANLSPGQIKSQSIIYPWMKPAPDQKSDLEIASMPLENIGRAFWAMPTAIYKDIEAGQIGAGEKWYQEEVVKDVNPTFGTRLFEGKIGEISDPSKQRENVITGLVEGALIFAPVGIGKSLPKINFPKINWSLPKNPFGKPTSSLDKMYGAPKPPKDVFGQDTALGMDQTKVNLGWGLGSQGIPKNPGASPSTPKPGVFESWFKADKSQPRTFKEPKPGAGEKIIQDPNTGMLKIVTTKVIPKPKTIQVQKGVLPKLQNGKLKVKTKVKTQQQQAQLFTFKVKPKTKTKTTQAFAPVFAQTPKLDQPFPPVLTTTQSFKQTPKYPPFVLLTQPTIPIPPMLRIPGGLPLFPGGRSRGGSGRNIYKLQQKFGEWDIKESPLIFGESFRESGRPALRVTKRPGVKKSKNGKKKNKSRKRKR